MTDSLCSSLRKYLPNTQVVWETLVYLSVILLSRNDAPEKKKWPVRLRTQTHKYFSKLSSYCAPCLGTRQKSFMWTAHYITEISKKMCSHRLRYNKINNFYCLTKNILKWTGFNKTKTTRGACWRTRPPAQSGANEFAGRPLDLVLRGQQFQWLLTFVPLVQISIIVSEKKIMSWRCCKPSFDLADPLKGQPKAVKTICELI